MSALGEAAVGRSGKAAAFLVNASTNASLVLVSTIVGYLAIEFIFFRVIFPLFDPSPRPPLPETPGVLAQNTKAGYVPHNYVAILGDSMAEGLGDALLVETNNQGRGFHAAHVIRNLTGVDVVTFGRGGSGSAEAFVRQAARILGGSRCAFFPTLDGPRRIFAYFYEGNDIQDNLRFASKVAQRFGSSSGAAIDAYLSDQYANFPKWHCHRYLFDVAGRLGRFFYVYYVTGIDPFFKPVSHGRGIVVGEDTIDPPDVLEGPALEVSDDSIRAGMTVFDRSLSWLRTSFPNVPVTVVHVPAALSIYRLNDTSYRYSIEPRDEGQSGWASAAQIARNSDFLCDEVRAASVRHGVGFLDTRPALRQVAATRLLHGPIDWHHFNRQGYQVLGTVLAGRTDPTLVDSCH
jgi:hypothetical protein